MDGPHRQAYAECLPKMFECIVSLPAPTLSSGQVNSVGLEVESNMMSENSANIVVYGTSWCPDCKRSKQFLGEHRIPYEWVDIEGDAEAARYVEHINRGQRSVPTIVFPDGSHLIEPSNAALAQKLGLNARASRTFYDVIIIGGGPTGLTAAIYTSREGLDTLVIERALPGGQMGITQRIDNFPGFDEGISGAEFADRLTRQAKRFGAEIMQAQEVRELGREGQYCVATVSDDEYAANAVLVASGSRYRRLGIPGEDELIGVNVHYCATCDGAFYKGKEVLVIGGGNSGFEEGLFLTKFASKVTIVEFLPDIRASKTLQDEVAKRDDMQVIANHAVKELRVSPDNKLAGVIVENRATGEVIEWHPDGIFVFIGLSPNTGFLPDMIEKDQWGFIKTSENLMTNIPGLFAAGDVRAGSTKQAASAAGEGATAALMIRQFLQESGEAKHLNSLGEVLESSVEITSS
jgi:thioredoxin reductase (NADPH)